MAGVEVGHVRHGRELDRSWIGRHAISAQNRNVVAGAHVRRVPAGVYHNLRNVERVLLASEPSVEPVVVVFIKREIRMNNNF